MLNQYKQNSDKIHFDMKGPTISPENIEKRKEVFSQEGAHNKGKRTLYNFHCILMYVRIPVRVVIAIKALRKNS